MLIVGRGQGGHRGARATCSAWGAGKMLIVGSGQGARRVPVHRVPQRDDPRATLRQYPASSSATPPSNPACAVRIYQLPLLCPPPQIPSPSSLHCPYTPRSSSSSWGVGKVVFADMSQASSLRRRRLLHHSREQDAQHDGGTVVEGGRVPGPENWSSMTKTQKTNWHKKNRGKWR